MGDEYGNYPCDESFGCEHSDSTWYPPQCDYSTNEHLNCMVLLQFSPEPNAFDAEFSRNLILQNELPLVVKYLGKRTSKRAQENFNRFFNSTEQSRVIYQLNSFDTQSIDTFGWAEILLPPEDAINEGQRVLIV